MEAKGWDQSTLSRQAHLNAATVSRWFTDDAQPSVKNIRQAAEALGAPVIEAMLAAEVVTEEEIGVKVVAPDPDLLTDEEVLRQVAKRMAIQNPPENIVVTRDPTAVDLPPTFRAVGEKQNGPHSAGRSR